MSERGERKGLRVEKRVRRKEEVKEANGLSAVGGRNEFAGFCCFKSNE